MDTEEIDRKELGLRRAEKLLHTGNAARRLSVKIEGANHGDGSAQLQNALQRAMADGPLAIELFTKAHEIMKADIHEARNVAQRALLAKQEDRDREAVPEGFALVGRRVAGPRSARAAHSPATVVPNDPDNPLSLPPAATIVRDDELQEGMVVEEEAQA